MLISIQGGRDSLSALVDLVARHLTRRLHGTVWSIKLLLDSLLNLLFQDCSKLLGLSRGTRGGAMRRTLHFLFLQLQLGLHVRECGLDLLKVLVRFRVCDVKTLMLPLLFSVKAGEKSEEQGSARRGNTHADTRSNSLSIVSGFASLPTSLRNLGLLTSRLREARSQMSCTSESCEPTYSASRSSCSLFLPS